MEISLAQRNDLEKVLLCLVGGAPAKLIEKSGKIFLKQRKKRVCGIFTAFKLRNCEKRVD